MLSYEVLLPWNNSVAVPDMPVEQWMGMSPQEREKFLLQGSPRVKGLSGAEKYWYAMRAQPLLYPYRWLVWFLPCFATLIVFGVLESRKRET
jgi:hypothetical protein